MQVKFAWKNFVDPWKSPSWRQLEKKKVILSTYARNYANRPKISTKFPHQEIRWNYGIFRSESYEKQKKCYICRKKIKEDVDDKNIVKLEITAIMQVNTEVPQKAYVIEDTLRGETFTGRKFRDFRKFWTSSLKFNTRKIFL